MKNKCYMYTQVHPPIFSTIHIPRLHGIIYLLILNHDHRLEFRRPSDRQETLSTLLEFLQLLLRLWSPSIDAVDLDAMTATCDVQIPILRMTKPPSVAYWGCYHSIWQQITSSLRSCKAALCSGDMSSIGRRTTSSRHLDMLQHIPASDGHPNKPNLDDVYI